MEHEYSRDFVKEDMPNKCYIRRKIFDAMRQRMEFCDLTITVGDRSIHAHRVILAASIPYFRSSLTPSTRKRDDDISLNDVSPAALEAIIDFAYRCTIKVTSENARMLLSAACVLQVDEVRNACVEFLAEVISTENVFTLRELGLKFGCLDLSNKCDDYTTETFDEISQSVGFLDQPYSYVKDILSKDELHVTNEEKVFEAAMRWIEASPDERCSEVSELLSCVRMPFLKLQYLKDHVASHELLKRNISCRDILDDARDYHLFPDRRTDLSTLKFSTTVRRYKEDAQKTKCESLAFSGVKWKSKWKWKSSRGSCFDEAFE